MTTVAAPVTSARSAVAARTGRVLWLPLGFIVLLAAFGALPAARSSSSLLWSILGAAAALFAGLILLSRKARDRALRVEVALRPQHYLQACAQGTVLLYWGAYWHPVYEFLPLIAAQLVFAYAFDMLLAWSHRDDYTLGFAPFPVIFSTNLFLWFKPEWFYLQFLMIAVGFAAKDLIRWQRDGRRVHIFNPSSFPLAVFSIVLLATGTTSMTFGPEIARTQFLPPHIYLVLFLVGLPGQLLFGVATMTMSAVVTTYLFGVIYFKLTGTYFFVDAYVPIAVFLGMHLLFTDPSTAPRSELGRIIFGVVYGLGNVILYELLGRAGLPTFYDKLLPVPLMNLSVRAIDRLVRSGWTRRLDPARLAPAFAGRPRNAAYVALWSAIFLALTTSNALGDNHPGHRVPFWQRACLQNARNACSTLSVILDSYCADGSTWACNEVGVLRFHGRGDNRDRAAADFERGCALGNATSCQNVNALKSGLGPPRQIRPQLKDYPVVLRTGKGALPDKTPAEFYTRACNQGWVTACEDVAAIYLRRENPARDPVRAAAALEKACAGGIATACSNLGYVYYSGDGVPKDSDKGKAYLKRACDVGYANACRWLSELPTSDAATPAP